MYYYLYPTQNNLFYMMFPSFKETMENKDEGGGEGGDKDKKEDKPPTPTAPKTCPDLLIQKGVRLYLYNTDIPESEGVNPLLFDTLDQYTQYLEKQRKKGIHCPILFLQQETNTQGKDVYRMRASPLDKTQQGIPTYTNINANELPKASKDYVHPVIDASRENPPYNNNMYPSFDPYGQDIGKYTKLDFIHESTSLPYKSDNPMDSNWGGTQYTQEMVLSGKYKDNEVYRPHANPFLK